jgi:hypothetical protein
VEDNASAEVRFASGAIGVIESNTSCSPGFPQQIDVSGERGTAAIEGDATVRWQFADVDPRDEPILAGMDGKGAGGGASDPRPSASRGTGGRSRTWWEPSCAEPNPRWTARRRSYRLGVLPRHLPGAPYADAENPSFIHHVPSCQPISRPL